MSEKQNSYQFSGKYIIKVDIRCITGLHVGGTDEGFEIGGIDNPVIKDPITGFPYIPGSSLKGKMRSLLEWADSIVKFGTDKNGNPTGSLCDCGTCDVCIIFGCSAKTAAKEPTRLTIRDAFPKGLFDNKGKRRNEDEITDGTIADWRHNLGEKVYTEAKTENAIDRLTSAANPRTMERVPADSVFEVEMIYDLYKNDDVNKLKRVFEGMALVEDSSLGGGGSRGSGKVKFENFCIIKRDVTFYTTEGKETEVELNGKNTAKEISDNFNKLFVTRA
ncbi:MAG: type III-A CRISPR-associated RAMP protein Csm3 [Thermodesulfobacteriota bacterium]